MTIVEDGDGAAAAASFPAVPPVTPTCGWPVVYSDCGGDCDYTAWGENAESAKEWFEAQAIELLWEWSNRVYGVCPVDVRPCRGDCQGWGGSTFWGRGPGYDPGFPRRGGSGWAPALIDGKWYNVGCGCAGTCRCEIDGAHAIRLPGPVVSIEEVLIDGQVVSPGSYRVDHKSLLVRTDGQTWPSCQDMLADPGEENTFVISYSKGIPVPVGGQVAAGRLACELSKGACDDDECALPDRLQTMTRQGISVGVALTGEDWEDTGIWSIDSWVKAINKPRPFAAAYSVDVPRRRR